MSSAAANAVFLSYSSQDAEAARKICDALRAAQVEVWFDQNELVGGDAWDAKIRGQIATCTLFVPIISANTQARLEGYFRIEWKLAAQRTHAMAEEKAFLLPVVIDDTRDAQARVPTEFKAVQWTRLSDGDSSEAFGARVLRLLDGRGGSIDRGAAPTADGSSPGPVRTRDGGLPAPAPRRPMRFVAVVVIAAAIGAALWQPWRDRAEPATSAKEAATSKPDAPESRSLSSPTEKSIAVLPFENLSDDKDGTGFFAEGMHEELLTSLANIGELRVVSRTSVMEYRGTTKKMPQIARELGVAYVLLGSVRRSGTQVRVSAQLIRAAVDQHLWAKSYGVALNPTEVFAVQTTLATEIGGALSAAISPEAKKRLAERPTDNLASYDLYLQARELTRGRLQFAAFEKAEALLQVAVKLDPKFGVAWAELSFVHSTFYASNLDRSEARRRKAEQAKDAALRLAPDSPVVMRAVGDYYRDVLDYASARQQFEKLARLQANDADVHHRLGNLNRRQGRWAEALAGFRRALALDRGNVRATLNLAGFLIDSRRYAEAAEVQRRVVELLPADREPRFSLAQIAFQATGSTRDVDAFFAGHPVSEQNVPAVRRLRKQWALTRGDTTAFAAEQDAPGTTDLEVAMMKVVMGDAAGARADAERSLARGRERLSSEPENSQQWAIIAQFEAVLGNKAEALRCADKAVELLPEAQDKYVGLWRSENRACVLAWVGEKDRAIAELARLLQLPTSFLNVHVMKRHPRYAPLHGDPRFEALLKDPKNNAPLF